MKLCIHCKHYRGVALSNGKRLCDEPRNNFVDPVDGFERKYDADWLRLDERYCGADGKWWEKKQ